MSVSYPPIAQFESGSENEDSSKKKKKKGGEVLDKGIDQISGLLKDFGKNSDKKLNKKLNKKSDNNSSKDIGKKTETESKSDEEPGEKSGKNSSKTDGQKSVSDDHKSDEEGGKDKRSSEHTKATSYTKEQREAATRVQQCGEKDYYGILDLPQDCSKIEVRQAYKKFSLLTHPDQNKYEDADTAFKMVSSAYQVLSDAEKRKGYDKNREKFKLRGQLDPIGLWDEQFADNASGNESDPEPGAGDNEEEEEEATKPGKEWVKIYEEATPYVRDLLADPENSSSKSEIKRLNKQIMELNNNHNRKVKKLKEKKSEGYREARYVEEDAFTIKDFNVLEFIGLEASKAIKSLKKDPKSKWARKTQEELEDQLERTIRINSYPQEWANCLPWIREDTRKRRAELGTSKEEKGKGRGKTNDAGSDTEMPDAGPSSKKKGKGKMREGTSSEQEDGGSDVDMRDVIDKRRKWYPGETRKGEKILGWRPFYKTDRKTDQQIYTGCQLVVEKKGEPNPIALLSGEEAGRRAVDAYRDLPEEEQNDIRYSEKKYTYKDAHKFDYILGFASVPSNGYALYLFTDGSEEIVSRTALRKVFGQTDADCEIEEFFDEIGEIAPPPRRFLLTNRSKVKRKHKSKRHAHSDNESDSSNSDSDSDSDSESDSSTQKKGRRRAREIDDGDSNVDSSRGGRKRSRTPKRERNSKTKKTKAIEANNQEMLASTLRKFIKDQAKESDRREKSMSKRFDRRFEEMLMRIQA